MTEARKAGKWWGLGPALAVIVLLLAMLAWTSAPKDAGWDKVAQTIALHERAHLKESSLLNMSSELSNYCAQAPKNDEDKAQKIGHVLGLGKMLSTLTLSPGVYPVLSHPMVVEAFAVCGKTLGLNSHGGSL